MRVEIKTIQVRNTSRFECTQCKTQVLVGILHGSNSIQLIRDLYKYTYKSLVEDVLFVLYWRCSEMVLPECISLAVCLWWTSNVQWHWNWVPTQWQSPNGSSLRSLLPTNTKNITTSWVFFISKWVGDISKQYKYIPVQWAKTFDRFWLAVWSFLPVRLCCLPTVTHS